MKKVLLAAAILLIVSVGFAGADGWKELEAFHTVMAGTFHPAEDGNLQPVRDKASDLLARAKTWQGSTVPPDCDQEKTAKALETLVDECEQVDSGVNAKKSDAELTKLITAAHDAFHAIVEKCRPKEGEKH
jgi:hypothetical protein